MDLHQNYLKAKQILENSLDGYCPKEEKYFKEFIGTIIKEYLTFLHDPRLPLDETREALASIQGRIQPKYVKLRFFEKATKFEKKSYSCFDKLCFPLKILNF